jgi:hypothetical protein
MMKKYFLIEIMAFGIILIPLISYMGILDFKKLKRTYDRNLTRQKIF